MILRGHSMVDALQVRAVARVLYPRTWTASRREAHRLQRKWLHAWRIAPGARVQIGPRPVLRKGDAAREFGRKAFAVIDQHSEANGN